MPATSHLKSLQAVELAVRTGSLKGAAEALGITPAAVGQRIRSLENYLGLDLLVRGRSGLHSTAELDLALDDLRAAFEALDRVTRTLDFQRTSEIHIVADPDWAELWLLPRLAAFRERNPNILFCINGEGDVPVRLGSPDLRIAHGGDAGEALFRDLLVPVTGPDNTRRIADWDPVNQMEGLPLLHVAERPGDEGRAGWSDWFEKFGQRKSGTDRGVRYKNARLALAAVRQNVGFLLCGLSLVLPDVRAGRIVLPFPISQHLTAPPYRLRRRQDAERRPQLRRFVDWLRAAARETRAELEAAAR